MERLGLGYEALREINPRLIYCSITGYGQNGPRAGEAGHDLNYIGDTGLLALQPGPAERPVVPPALIADIGGGTMPAVINILLALRQRDRTRGGLPSRHRHDRRDVHLRLPRAGASGQATGQFPGPGERAAGRRLAALPALSDARRQARGLRALEQKFWDAFSAAIGLRGDVDRRRRDPAATRAAVAAIIAGRTAERMAAAARRRRLLRDHRGDARRGAARSAFHRARPVRAPGRRTDRARRCRRLPVPIAPAFRAPRENVSRCRRSARITKPLQRLAAHQPRLRQSRRREPSRMTARRSGAMRSSKVKAEARAPCTGRKSDSSERLSRSTAIVRLLHVGAALRVVARQQRQARRCRRRRGARRRPARRSSRHRAARG